MLYVCLPPLFCRLNKSLEKQLHDAENRAAQLKEAYVAKNKQVQLLLAQKSTTSIKVADSSLTRLPDYFSDASQIEIDNLRSEANSEPPQHANFIVMAVEQDIIPIHNINSPRLQHALKKKEADIERLQRALDKAFDNQRGQAESFATLTAHLQQKEQVGKWQVRKQSVIVFWLDVDGKTWQNSCHAFSRS